MEEITEQDIMEGGEGAKSMQLNEMSQHFLAETAKWSRFLSIIGFIGLALMALMALVFILAPNSTVTATLTQNGVQQEEVNTRVVGVFMGILYLLMCLLYYFPVSYLYKFSTRMRDALDVGDENSLQSSFENLKKHYKFIGILTAVVLGIYVFFGLIGVIVGSMT